MDKKYSSVVCSSLFRVMKNNDFYEKIVEQLNKLSSYRNCGDNPLTNFRNVEELSEKLYNFTTHQYNKSNHGGGKYEFITMCINHLLHFIVEYTDIDKRRLGMLGQETFDIACNQLFGDEYAKDMDNLNHGAPRPTNDIEAMLVGEFMSLIHNGKNITWEDYLKYKGYSWKHKNEGIMDEVDRYLIM